MKIVRLNKKGITLVELLLAMAILGVVVAVTFTVLTAGIKTYNLNYKSTVGQQELRSAMIKITKQVRNAASGSVAITGTKVLTVSSKDFTVSSGSLLYDGKTLAQNMASISADYTDTGHKTIQVDLTTSDGNTLSTQIRVN